MMLMVLWVARAACDGDPLVRSKTRLPILSPADDAAHVASIVQAEENALAKIADRDLWIHAKRGFADMHMVGFGWILFTPYWNCPWLLDRSAGALARDGPKWTCGLRELQRRDCVVYSFGSRKETSFERRVLELAPNCEVHIFDRSAPVHPKGERVFYHCLWLQAEGNFTLASIMRRLGHSHVDLLKMDIESTEWPVIRNWDSSLPIGQIAVELHLRPDLPPLVHVVNAHFSILERLGFRLISIEPVGPGSTEEAAAEISLGRHKGGRPVEVVFLHKAWTPHGFASSLLT